jgi:hypothetical protein
VKNEKDREDLLEMAKAWNQLALSKSRQAAEDRSKGRHCLCAIMINRPLPR